MLERGLLEIAGGQRAKAVNTPGSRRFPDSVFVGHRAHAAASQRVGDGLELLWIGDRRRSICRRPRSPQVLHAITAADAATARMPPSLLIVAKRTRFLTCCADERAHTVEHPGSDR